MAARLVQVDITFLLGKPVNRLEENVRVSHFRLLAGCLLHEHLCPIILKQRSNGHIGISDLVLEIREALVSQLGGQA